MKKYLIFFLTLVSYLSYWTIYTQWSRQEFENIKNLEKGITEPFIIPDYFIFSDSESIYPILLEVAEEYGINLFRTSMLSTEEIKKYILLTDETHFFDDLTLKDGEVLSVEDTQQSSFFMTSMKTGEANQKGQLVYFGNQGNVTIQPLIAAYHSLPVSGTYYAELPEGVELEIVLTSFASKLSDYFSDYLTDDFEASDFIFQDSEYGEMMASGFLEQLIVFFLVVTLIVGIYYVFSQSKKISILKLNGLSHIKIWNIVIGKLVISAFIFSTVAIFIFSLALAIYYREFYFLSSVISRQVLMYMLIFLLSMGAYVGISRVPIHQGVKNKNNTRYVFILNTFLKGGLSVAILLIAFSTLTKYENLKYKEGMLSNWEVSEEYGVFYPYYTSREDSYATEAIMYTDLYRVLNKMDAILINTKDFEEIDFLLNDDRFRYTSVNINYLEAFPIYDVNDKPILFEEQDQDFIILVPEKYKDQEAEILENFKEDREWRAEIDEEVYQLEVDDKLKNPEFKMVWIKNDQSIFSFNPDVYPAEQNEIKNPIIKVITENNSLAVEREIILGGGATDPLKIKLVDNDYQKTYELLYPKLQELGLENNLKQLITVDEWVLQQISEIKTELSFTLIIIMVISIVPLALSLQNTILFFHQNQQKYIIKRLFGVSFFRTYLNYFYYMAGLWSAQLIVIFIYQYIGDIQISWEVVILFLGIETVLSIVAIQLLEKKNKLSVLKGDE